ncbi:MAG: acyltransferase [Bacteroidetes bacterium]|nr:acyltransferase [Bacteroidota bacterium]
MFIKGLIDSRRNFGLDIIRALSIMLVVYSHSGTFFLQESGIIGVEFFFVLSGFLIGQILFRSFANKGDLEIQDLFGFWKKRWWRTLPLYYLVILVKFFATGCSIGWNIVYYLFFLQNHFYGISFMGVTWSLVIEEWFYLLIPVLLYILHRRKTTIKRIIFILVSFCLALLALKLYFAFVRHTPFTGIRPSVPLRLDSLCMGVILAYFRESDPLKYERLNKPLFPILSLLIIVSLAFMIRGVPDPAALVESNPWARALWFPVFSLAVVLMVPYFEKSTWINVSLKKIKILYKPLTLISILTYSIYLTHLFTIQLAESCLGAAGNFIAVKYIAIVVFAFVVYVLYEHPMTQLRERRFFGQK